MSRDRLRRRVWQATSAAVILAFAKPVGRAPQRSAAAMPSQTTTFSFDEQAPSPAPLAGAESRAPRADAFRDALADKFPANVAGAPLRPMPAPGRGLPSRRQIQSPPEDERSPSAGPEAPPQPHRLRERVAAPGKPHPPAATDPSTPAKTATSNSATSPSHDSRLRPVEFRADKNKPLAAVKDSVSRTPAKVGSRAWQSPGDRHQSPFFAQVQAPREPRARSRAPTHFRPLLLSALLGRHALLPPPTKLRAPVGLARAAARRPRVAPDGTLLAQKTASAASIAEIDPAHLPRDSRPEAHWDGKRWHDGHARGELLNDGWATYYHDADGWWSQAGPTAQPLLRRGGVWWLKTDGLWFVLHDGVAWARRSFQDWDAEGLFHPGTGTEMIYSRDFTRVAVVTPGEGAVVFDAVTGHEVAAIPEALMPARRRPLAKLARPPVWP